MIVVIKYIPEDSVFTVRDVDTVMTDGINDCLFLRIKGKSPMCRYPKEEFEVLEVIYE